jgi:hypothetical protein
LSSPALYPLPSVYEPRVPQHEVWVCAALDEELTGVQVSGPWLEVPRGGERDSDAQGVVREGQRERERERCAGSGEGGTERERESDAQEVVREGQRERERDSDAQGVVRERERERESDV